MAFRYQIRRESTAAGVEQNSASLYDGELIYDKINNRLFIGNNSSEIGVSEITYEYKDNHTPDIISSFTDDIRRGIQVNSDGDVIPFVTVNDETTNEPLRLGLDDKPFLSVATQQLCTPSIKVSDDASFGINITDSKINIGDVMSCDDNSVVISNKLTVKSGSDDTVAYDFTVDTDDGCMYISNSDGEGILAMNKDGLCVTTNIYSETVYAAKIEGLVLSDGADYAEYFEWADGNPNNEDRRGMFVNLNSDGKIELANGTSTHVLGIVSSRPSIIGDAYDDEWHGKYKKDIYGSYILDDSGDKIISDEYDESLEYIPRCKRPEWSAIAMIGKVVVNTIDSEDIKISEWAYSFKDGVLTSTFFSPRLSVGFIRILKRIDNKHVMVVMR